MRKRVRGSIRGLRGLERTQADFTSGIVVSQRYLSVVEHERNEAGSEVLFGLVENLILHWNGSSRARNRSV